LHKACLAFHDRYPTLVADKERQAEYPYPRSFGPEGSRSTFKYEDVLEGTRVFRATIDHPAVDQPRNIYVKFARRYSEEAHMFAYTHGFAPPLLAVEICHEWYMVVMEDVSDRYTTWKN
jgi:hypothetical protein